MWEMYLQAFTAGLFAAAHCVGMCGGIVGALGLGLPPERQRRLGTLLPMVLAYNLGRILSYIAAGALVGGVAALAADMGSLQTGKLLLQLLAGLFMVVLGLYLGGWWFGLLKVERLGAGVWARLEPWARRLLPVRGLGHAVVLGLVWGWIPCGVVYTMLINATAAGGALEGALFMACFGLGSLPAMLGLGLFSGRLAAFLRQRWVRSLAGGSVLLLGVWTLYLALSALLA